MYIYILHYDKCKVKFVMCILHYTEVFRTPTFQTYLLLFRIFSVSNLTYLKCKFNSCSVYHFTIYIYINKLWISKIQKNFNQ